MAPALPLDPAAALDDRPTDHRVEWWYFFGEVWPEDPDERGRWSFVSVLLKKRLPVPGGLAAWLCATQIVDLREDRRVDVGTRAASSFCFDADTFTWTLAGPPFGVDWSLARSPGAWRLTWRGAAGLDLALNDRGPAVLVGDAGVMDYGGGNRLGWYTRPFLEAVGDLEVGHRRVAVRGHAWMERQWGGAPVETFTWRYLTLRLEDGPRLLLFHTLVEGRHRTFGVALAEDGGSTELRNLRLTRVPPPSPDGPPTTEVVADGVHLLVSALAADQLITPGLPGTPPFYEGFSRVCGTFDGRCVTGVGMTELRAPSGDFVRAPAV